MSDGTHRDLETIARNLADDTQVEISLEDGTMTKSLYDTDFHAWAQQQAHALKTKDWAALDLDNLVEEVESLARSECRSLRIEAQRLLMHALKWRYQPDHRSESWHHTIEQARDEIEEVLRENPSLQSPLLEAFSAGYRLARRQAARETHLPLATFPEPCPWPVDQMLTGDWLPPCERRSARSWAERQASSTARSSTSRGRCATTRPTAWPWLCAGPSMASLRLPISAA